MGIFLGKYKHPHGFTIVELLIVIAVIAILASIVIVAYPGYQKRTRDNERKSDLSQIVSALGIYAQQKNTFVDGGSGCGLGGNGNGWFNASSSDIGTYQNPIAKCLQDAGLITNGTFVDPSGCIWGSGSGGCSANPARAYMKATCTKNSSPITYVFAALETETPFSVATIDGLCDAGSVTGFDATTQKWGTNYGMNYYVSVR